MGAVAPRPKGRFWVPGAEKKEAGWRRRERSKSIIKKDINTRYGQEKVEQGLILGPPRPGAEAPGMAQ
jgi:hypothetical protein